MSPLTGLGIYWDSGTTKIPLLTELFQRDDPAGDGEGDARSQFRLQPGRVNAELPTQFMTDARGRWTASHG